MHHDSFPRRNIPAHYLRNDRGSRLCATLYFKLKYMHLYIFSFSFNCMFYQLLRVQHSFSPTQSWGSVLPFIVETRDQNSRDCPLLFSNRNLGFFCCIGDRNPIHPQPLGSCGPLQE